MAGVGDDSVNPLQNEMTEAFVRREFGFTLGANTSERHEVEKRATYATS